MITRVEIDGFKSLRSFTIDLEPLTAIVGANGTGKSNLFDALQLLSRLASAGVTEALAEGRGSRRDQFARTRDDVGRSMSLAVELLLSSGASRSPGPRQTRVRYEIVIERSVEPSGLEGLLIRRECLSAIRAVDDRWMARHPALAKAARYEQELTCVERSGTPRDTLNPYTTSILAHPLASDPLAADIGEELRGFRFLHVEPAKLRSTSERTAPRTLAPDGSNLPTALAAQSPEIRASIQADLASVLPSFRSFDLVSIGDDLGVEVELTDGQRLPARVLSDGTLRLLALFTLLRSSRPGSMIAMEEAENGIHPAGLRELMAELVAITRPSGEVPRQLLLNSHSPAIVAALHDVPDALVFADLIRRRDGLHSTRMRHLWRAGDPEDRGATTASARELERILETAQPVDEVA